MNDDEILVKIYSDKTNKVRVGGSMVNLPPGDYTKKDLLQIGGVFEIAATRMLERRGTLKWSQGMD